MTKHVIISVKRAVLNWRSLLGVAMSALAVSSGLLGSPLGIPSQVWWGLAVFLMFVTACIGFYEAERERDSKRKVLPDMALEEVVCQIVGVSADRLFDYDNPQKVSDALLDIREKALLGAIDTWGRRDCNSMDLRFYPLDTVDRGSWAFRHIDYLAFMRDRLCALGVASGQPREFRVSDIHMNRDQVDRTWPKKPMRRFNLGWPVRKAAA